MNRTARTLLATAAIALATLGLAACSPGGSGSVVGTWGDPDAAETPSLVFEEDGSYHGTDGCNRVMGSWEADGGTVSLGAMASTMMHCEGVDTWLSGGASAKVDGDKLIISDEGDEQIGTLERKK